MVRAHVIRCPEGGGHAFVAYMEKYSDSAREKLLAADHPTDVLPDLKPEDRLLARPGEPWRPAGQVPPATIRAATCPTHGVAGELLTPPLGDATR